MAIHRSALLICASALHASRARWRDGAQPVRRAAGQAARARRVLSVRHRSAGGVVTSWRSLLLAIQRLLLLLLEAGRVGIVSGRGGLLVILDIAAELGVVAEPDEEARDGDGCNAAHDTTNDGTNGCRGPTAAAAAAAISRTAASAARCWRP
ncbi:hypothetical protein HYQ46_001675 [Verticillium longisporum]|nr:hypothetical protein HYQ46_001675 [Verticillium longisporum]